MQWNQDCRNGNAFAGKMYHRQIGNPWFREAN